MKRPQPGDKIAVWFSCGAASAIAAKKTIELYGDTCEIVVINNFIKEEKDRFDSFQLNERPASLYILADTTKGECFEMIMDAGIKLPDMYLMDYPNANCPGCVKATSPTYWNHVRVKHPLVFKQRCEMSRRLGVRLVRYKGKRIFLDELPPDAKGRSMKNMNFECGIFCGTDKKIKSYESIHPN